MMKMKKGEPFLRKNQPQSSLNKVQALKEKQVTNFLVLVLFFSLKVAAVGDYCATYHS